MGAGGQPEVSHVNVTLDPSHSDTVFGLIVTDGASETVRYRDTCKNNRFRIVSLAYRILDIGSDPHTRCGPYMPWRTRRTRCRHIWFCSLDGSRRHRQCKTGCSGGRTNDFGIGRSSHDLTCRRGKESACLRAWDILVECLELHNHGCNERRTVRQD